MDEREQLSILKQQLSEETPKIQALKDPRQVGKTSLIEQFMQTCSEPYHYATVDLPGLPDPQRLQQQWDIARLKPGSI